MFDPSTLTGPLGGIIAIAYGAGAASGYAFCIRTMYKILKSQSDKDEEECKERLLEANKEIERLQEKCEGMTGEIRVLNERLILGINRQQEQTRESGMRLLGKYRDVEDRNDV